MSAEERQAFSVRLQEALRNSNNAPDSPTQLAREFNLRFPGRAITVHAARKWLLGDAIPTQQKLRILAQWLGVSAEWLRFGSDGEASGPKSVRAPVRLHAKDLALLNDLQKLDDRHRHIVHAIVSLLVRASSRK